MNKIFNKQLIKQLCLVVSVTVFSISFGAFASTVIDSTGITTNNILTEGFKVHVPSSTDDINDVITVATATPQYYNIGIGTTTPEDRLHIYKGNLQFSGVMYPAIQLGTDVQALKIQSAIDNLSIGNSEASYEFWTTPDNGFVQNSRTRVDENTWVGSRVVSFPATTSLDAFIMHNLGVGTMYSEGVKLKVSGDSIFDGSGIFRNNLSINNTLSTEEAQLDLNGTYNDASAALLGITGTSSRLMFTSGVSVSPTSWSLGINTGLEDEPTQDFQIRQVNFNRGLLDTRLSILDSNGFVGIATSSPKATLDINGFMRLKVNSGEPVVCSATNDGSIALNSNYELCTCKGATGWVKTASSTQACVW